MDEMNIRTARKEAALTMAQTSEILGIPLRTLEDWELGKRKPPEYIEKMIIEQLFWYTTKQTAKEQVYEEVNFAKLKEMDYYDGLQYLIALGYRKKPDKKHVEEGRISEFWEMTLRPCDPEGNADESKEWNTSIITWEYRIPEGKIKRLSVKWDNGYWNYYKPVGKEL